WLTFAPGEIRTCTSCHGINLVDQANHPTPTNSPLALVSLLNYWRTNACLQSGVLAMQGTNCLQISFVRRPAEQGVTYHVQASTNLTAWSDVATYSGTNVVLTPQVVEVSRLGAPNETVTIADASPITRQRKRFLRVNVTRP